MHRIFLPLYKFLKQHKGLMHALLWGSFAVFVFFAVQLHLEENILKLLPKEATDNELAFSDIELKDKAFIQITSRDAGNPVDPAELGAAMEEYCTMLEESDSNGTYIKGILHSLDMDLAMNAMDFGLDHLPSFVDTAWYNAIEKATERSAIDKMMEQNYNIVMADETGEASKFTAMDPLGLRHVVLGELFPGGISSMGGFAIVDGHLMCPDKTVALAFLSPNFSAMNSGYSTKLYRLMYKAKEKLEAEHPEVKVLCHGDLINSVSNASTIKKDVAGTVGISLIIILIIILFSFHRFSFVMQQVVPITYGTAFALACMYWIKGYMSLMALGIGAVVLGVAISYCLHALIHYYFVKDTETMLREESTPIFLGCLTTIGAFMGLIFTESELLSDFGLFATFALIGNTLFVLIFLPHFMKPSQIKFKRTHGFPLVEKVNSLPWDRNPWIIGSLIVIIIVGFIFAPKVKFDSDLRNLNYLTQDVVESERLYNSKNTADGAMHMFFATHDEESLDKALEYGSTFFHALDSLVDEGLVKSYNPIVKRLLISKSEQENRIAAWQAFWTPDRLKVLEKDLAESAKAHGLPADFAAPFLAIASADYEPGDLYESGIVPTGLMSNYVEKQESGRYMAFTDVAFAPEDTDIVIAALVSQPNVLVVQPFYYCRDMVEIIHDDFNTTLMISSIFVFLVLLFSFRNFLIALLAFLPMSISWFVLQGYMAIFGLEFNLINRVISTFIFGIGVDYSIFVMEGLLAQARKGKSEMLAYHKVAIVFSATVLAIVTFALIFATHPSIHSIGIITLIGMALTILITYSLQPWAFRLLMKVPALRRSFGIKDDEPER